MTTPASSFLLADLAKAVGGVLRPGATLAMELLGSTPVPLPKRQCSCGCEIPPPCWAPQPLGQVTARACPGGNAVLRLNITNCGAVSRSITVEATNSAVVVEPASVSLGPIEQGQIVVTLAIPATAPAGEVATSLIWVKGCNEHYVRWTVEAAGGGSSCSIDHVSVEDCPDYVHHWYDHFYCRRTCPP